MKQIVLKGRLGKDFGESHFFDISSPAEGMRALCTQIPGFAEAVKEGHYRVARIVEESDKEIGEEELRLSFGKSSGFSIEPIPAGGKKGVGKLILGAVLIGVAIWAAPFAVAAGVGSFTATAVSTLGSMGAMMALQGASMLLTPTPAAATNEEDTDSFLLDATGNLVEQGHGVPLVVGRCYVGSVVISTGLAVEDVDLTGS